MAQNPYSTKILAAYANIDPQKRLVADLAKDPTKKTQYNAALKLLKKFQDDFNELKKQELDWKNEQTKNKNTKAGVGKQTDLDIALSVGDTNKANQIAAKMIDLGVQPKGLDGKPLPDFQVKEENVVVAKPADSDKDGIPDTVDAQPKVSSKKPAAGPAGKGKEKVTDVDPKVIYTDALRETFKSLPKEYKSEIDNLLSQATKGKWKESAFMAELQKTQWWQTSLPSLQAYFIESHDPRNKGTFAEKIRNNADAVARQLESLGINTTQVDPITGNFVDNTKVIQGLASLKLMNGWTDAQFTQHLAENAQVHFSSGGTIGSALDTIKRQALAYGINIDKNYEKQIQFSLLDPTDGRDAQYYLNEMKNQAMDTYKPFAESIKQGRSLYEVTSNYRTKMANLLETDATNVTWQDLMGKVIDPTTGTARMESEFIKQVKKDPLWQYTKNAKETYSNTALDLMKQFGFIG